MELGSGRWRSDEMIRKLQYLGVDAVISIGGDGSQRISTIIRKRTQHYWCSKTIDNDLSATDFTFGFKRLYKSQQKR